MFTLLDRILSLHDFCVLVSNLFFEQTNSCVLPIRLFQYLLSW